LKQQSGMLKEDITATTTTVKSTMEVVFDILQIVDRGRGERGVGVRNFDNPYDNNDHRRHPNHPNHPNHNHHHMDERAIQQTEIKNNKEAVLLDDSQLKGILKVLCENDLLSFDSATRKFKITQKGRKFVQIYNKMNDLLKEEA
jgi:predicted transcriptional regulator